LEIVLATPLERNHGLRRERIRLLDCFRHAAGYARIPSPPVEPCAELQIWLIRDREM